MTVNQVNNISTAATSRTENNKQKLIKIGLITGASTGLIGSGLVDIFEGLKENKPPKTKGALSAILKIAAWVSGGGAIGALAGKLIHEHKTDKST